MIAKGLEFLFGEEMEKKTAKVIERIDIPGDTPIMRDIKKLAAYYGWKPKISKTEELIKQVVEGPDIKQG